MATITFDSTDLLAHATLDGNTCTEIDTGVVQKKEFADVHQDTLDSNWTETGLVYTENGSVSKVSGTARVAVTGTGSNNVYRSKAIRTPANYNDGDFSVQMKNYSATVAGNADGYAGIMLYKDSSNYALIMKYYSAGSYNLYFLTVDGGSQTTRGPVATTSADVELRLLASSGTYSGYYRAIGAGSWTQIGASISATLGSDLYFAYNTTMDVSALQADFDNLVITGSGVYWNNDPVVTYTPDTSEIGGTIDFSNTTGTFDATTKIDVSVNGGSTWYGTDLDLAGVQALGDTTILAGGLTIRTTHENTTSQTGFTEIAFDVTPAAGGAFVPFQIFQPLGGL